MQHNHIDERGRIDFAGIQAGAEKAVQDREDARQAYWKAREDELAKKDKQMDELQAKLAASVTADNKAQAEAKIKEETERAAKEIRDKYNKEHNVKEESDLDRAYRGLLKGNE